MHLYVSISLSVCVCVCLCVCVVGFSNILCQLYEITHKCLLHSTLTNRQRSDDVNYEPLMKLTVSLQTFFYRSEQFISRQLNVRTLLFTKSSFSNAPCDVSSAQESKHFFGERIKENTGLSTMTHCTYCHCVSRIVFIA